jgi:putative membrane protein
MKSKLYLAAIAAAMVGISVPNLNAQSSNQNGGSYSGQSGGSYSSQSGSSSGKTSSGTASRSQSSTMDRSSNSSSTSMNKTSGNSVSSEDRRFMTEAAQGGMAEVELGKLAATKASDPAVKDFAQKMVQDHGKANDELKETASKLGVDLPSSIGKHEATKDRLSKLSGPAFDKAYMTEMLKDHKKDVSDFQKVANNSKNDELKEFASETLPTLQDHLKTAEQTNAKVNGSASSASMRQ